MNPVQRSLTSLITCALVALSLATAHAARAAEKPNIVFVLFDDMGWGQPQSYRPESALRTPNLDRLATQGMRFTDAHSASGVCTPTESRLPSSAGCCRCRRSRSR